jgi:hypothetical protein
VKCLFFYSSSQDVFYQATHKLRWLLKAYDPDPSFETFRRQVVEDEDYFTSLSQFGITWGFVRPHIGFIWDPKTEAFNRALSEFCAWFDQTMDNPKNRNSVGGYRFVEFHPGQRCYEALLQLHPEGEAE